MPISNLKLISTVGPVTVAVVALSIAVLATGNETSIGEGAHSTQAEPTPYSADHSRIESNARTVTEQPATF